MAHQPAKGTRDLLPIEVAQKIEIERRLQDRFRRWGYLRIITSTLERLDTLMAGGAIQRSNVIQLQGTEEEEELGLRPELTASIARAAVTRMDNEQLPHRLFYNANVFRKGREMGQGGYQEFYQTGVELLGAKGVLADAEILLLLSECLEAVGINEWDLILGEASLTQAILADFPPEWQGLVRWSIAHLDRISLELFATDKFMDAVQQFSHHHLPSKKLSAELRDRALFLFDLRGQPADVLNKVSQINLDQSQRLALEHLKSLLEVLENSTIPPANIHLDLSLIQTIDYYTGIVFKVVNHTTKAPRILGQGGRYDRLLELYHPQGKNYPGIGFCLNIEDLQQVLSHQGELTDKEPLIDYLIVPETPGAYAQTFAYAQTLRKSAKPVTVEIQLEAETTPEAVEEYAKNRGIKQIVWINSKVTG